MVACREKGIAIAFWCADCNFLWLQEAFSGLLLESFYTMNKACPNCGKSSVKVRLIFLQRGKGKKRESERGGVG